MCTYIVKTMYLEKPKHLIIWNRGSTILAEPIIAYCHMLQISKKKGKKRWDFPMKALFISSLNQGGWRGLGGF